jgi:hypothetical protein
LIESGRRGPPAAEFAGDRLAAPQPDITAGQGRVELGVRGVKLNDLMKTARLYGRPETFFDHRSSAAPDQAHQPGQQPCLLHQLYAGARFPVLLAAMGHLLDLPAGSDQFAAAAVTMGEHLRSVGTVRAAHKANSGRLA